MPKAAKEEKSESEKKVTGSISSISNGDIILIETEVRIKEDNQLIDTTNKELAEKEGIYDENHPYGPQLVVVGEKWLVQQIDEDIINGNLMVGDEKEYEIPASDPSNPFGQRNPDNIRTHSIREFRKADIDVRKNLGKRIDFKGKKVTILGERGGRVRVDYNHPFAGSTLLFKIKINEKLESDEEILNKILTMQFRGLPLEKIDKKVDEKLKTISIILPPETSMIQGLEMAKFGAARFIISRLKNFDNIEFISKFTREFFEPKIKPTPSEEEKKEE